MKSKVDKPATAFALFQMAVLLYSSKSSCADLVMNTSVAQEPGGYPPRCGKNQLSMPRILVSVFCCFGVRLMFLGVRGAQYFVAPLPLAQSGPPNSFGHSG